MAKIYQWFRETLGRVGWRVILVLAGYLLLALLAVALTDGWIGVVADKDTRIAQCRDTISVLEQLRTNLLRVESIQRGYLLTGRDSYFVAYDDSIKHVNASLRQLEAQLEDSPDHPQSKNHDELLKRITANLIGKLTEMQMVVTLAHDGNTDDALKVVNTDEGLVKMTNFFNDTQLLLDEKNKELQSLFASRDRLMLAGRTSVWASVLIVLVLVVLVVKKLLAEITDRDRESKKLESEVSNFEQQLEQRTSLLKKLAVDYQYDVERERGKLARELHDELGSILTATKMDISWVLRKIKDIAPEASEKLQKTMRYLDQAIQFKRRVVENLHPPLLTSFGLIPALESLITSAAERNQWQLDLELPSETTVISEPLGLIAYRLVQETLNNASKYAQASKISVHLQVDEQHLKLEMEDNGRGLDMNLQRAVTHGLEGMRHRVDAIGGKLQITSEPGKGMFTLALIPLHAAPDAAPAGDRRIGLPRASVAIEAQDTENPVEPV